MSLSPDRPPSSQVEPATGSTPGSASGAFAIETQGLSKHFGRRTAVDGLTISVPVGTIAGFIGPNGAGKRPPFACCSDWCDLMREARRSWDNR